MSNTRDNNEKQRSTASQIVEVFQFVGKLIVVWPLQGISWLGNKILRPIFGLVDYTPFGKWVEERCYSVGGPSFVAGDAGYIGFALERGSNLQLSGSVTTLVAHGFSALIGDKDPLILKWTKPKDETKPKTAFRKAAEWLVKKDRFIVPAVWTALSYNGLSLLIPAFLGALKAGMTLATLAFLPQIFLGIAVLIGCLSLARFEYANRTLKKEKDHKARIEKDAQEMGDLVTQEYLKIHADKIADQTEEQKNALESEARQLGNLARDEHLKHAFAFNNIPTDEDIAAREKSIGKTGQFAFGILGSATMLTIVTAIASGSLSLIIISIPAFLLGNYCQYKMTQIEAAAQKPNIKAPQAQTKSPLI